MKDEYPWFDFKLFKTIDEMLSTPRRELAPPIEEDEDQDSEVQRTAPLRQIENNISALLRGDIAVARVGGEYIKMIVVLKTSINLYTFFTDIPQPRRPLGFRPGVHKSESAKEMLLFQNIFGPLPPSPPSSTEVYTHNFIVIIHVYIKVFNFNPIIRNVMDFHRYHHHRKTNYAMMLIFLRAACKKYV